MVERDKNHPSGDLLVARQRERLRPEPRRRGRLAARLRPDAAAALRGRDQRATGAAGYRATDVVCPMYADVGSIEAFAARTSDDPRPLILCEFSHAMGNSNGGLADYYAAFDRHDALQGGFVWEWIDHGIRRPATTGPTAATSARRRHDANFCADGPAWPDRTPHPAMHELKYLVGAAGDRAPAAAGGSGSTTATSSPAWTTCAASGRAASCRTSGESTLRRRRARARDDALLRRRP